MDPDTKNRLLNETNHAAIALIEDGRWIRELLDDPTKITRQSVRALSAVLRRLLIDGDLQKIAAPRAGKIKITAPSVSDSDKTGLELFVKGGSAIDAYPYMTEFSVGKPRIEDGQPTWQVLIGTVGTKGAKDNREVNEGVRKNRLAVRSDQFLDERVLGLSGKWATRRDVIKFVANKESGVHSDSPDTDIEKMLARLRTFVFSNGFSYTVDFDPLFGAAEIRRGYEFKLLDIVLYELLACAEFLFSSPDVMALEQGIRIEHKM